MPAVCNTAVSHGDSDSRHVSGPASQFSILCYLGSFAGELYQRAAPQSRVLQLSMILQASTWWSGFGHSQESPRTRYVDFINLGLPSALLRSDGQARERLEELDSAWSWFSLPAH